MADLSKFLKDVRDHRMSVEIDQGVHRSLLFKRTGSSTYLFRLNTWPGHLSISGDMGDFVFSRLHDMFEFFRDDQMQNRINLRYWSEKLTAHDKGSGHMQFSHEKFSQAILSQFQNWEFSDDTQRENALARLNDDWDGLLGAPQHDLSEAIASAEEYTCPVTGKGFSEIWDYNLQDYTYQFVWCCRAIAWGIKHYDLAKSGRTQADHDRLVLAGAA